MELKKIRNQANKTQAEVAKYLGISQSTFAGYENERHQPTTQIIEKLADYYSCSIDELFGRVPQLYKMEPEESRLLGLFRQLPQNRRPRIIEYTQMQLDFIRTYGNSKA